ncbi:MAG: hypothetical protein JXB39_00275 [Deltaproteobacteria bacterium]|nr:hypothetical protein [Deltaproteobacteria bacterium]
MEHLLLRLDQDGCVLGQWPLSGGPVTLRLVDLASGREIVVLSWAAPGTADDAITRILPLAGLSESPTVPRAPEVPDDATTAVAWRLEEAPAQDPADEEDDLTLPFPE